MSDSDTLTIRFRSAACECDRQKRYQIQRTHFFLNWCLNATEHGSDLDISEGRSVLRAVLIGPDQV